MRRCFAIAMLAVYLFNLAGYNFLFHYYIRHSDEIISQRANTHDFSESSLLEIKVKLNLPYMSNWADYESYEGEIEVQGVHYNYVKRKIAQDTLYLLCLPNELKTKLYNTKTEYAVKANDLPAEKQNKNSGAKKNFVQEARQVQPVQFNFQSFSNEGSIANFPFTTALSNTYIPFIGKPPEAAC